MPRKKEGQNKQQSYSASYLTSREKTPMSKEKREKKSFQKASPLSKSMTICEFDPHNKFYHNPSHYFGIKQHPNTSFSHLLVKDTERTHLAPLFSPALQKRNFPLTKVYIKKKKSN